MAVSSIPWQTRIETLARRLEGIDAAVCARFTAVARPRPLLVLFRLVSRLGDGLFWYALMAGLWLFSEDGPRLVLQMAATGVAGVLVYKLLKNGLARRERPFVHHPAIRCAAPPLDRYSFPSGHTLHAVAFSHIACAQLPELAWILYPFTALVAASRLVLGLHYPSDVLAGALLGHALAGWGLDLLPPS